MTAVKAAANDAEDRPNLGDTPDFRDPDTPHDTGDHIGVYCGECGMQSATVVLAGPTSADHWQDKQLSWQEDCDTVFRAFDDAVAAHFPDHLPVNCQDCPAPPALPEKPIRPVERTIAQNAR